NAVAQGRIMRAWTFHVLTDLWGDVGYTEALQGRNPEAGNTPSFDPQATVYDGLLAELAAAQGSCTAGGGELTGADLIYSGNTERWRKFANSMRMRLAMRLSEAAEAKGRTEFAAALAAGPFTS